MLHEIRGLKLVFSEGHISIMAALKGPVKWQRRFFVLYEHGCLRFALDESPSTLPQGTVNMNLCVDVIDAEPKTGQKNSLCISTPDQEYFIRGENKEIINGWSEQLVVYPRTNKQNQKKKRKVEPTTSQEPGPAKVAVTGSGIPDAEKVPDSSSIIWQEELNQREADGAAVWAAPDLPPTGEGASVTQGSDTGSVNGDEVDQGGLALHSSAPQAHGDLRSPTGSCSSLGGVPRCLSPAPSDPFPSGSSLLSNGSHISGSVSSLDSDASGSTVTSTDSHPAEARKAEKRGRFRSPDRQEREAVLSPESVRHTVHVQLPVSQRPPTSGPQPAAPNRRPPTGGPQPAAPNRRPPTSGPQPAAPNRRPPTGGPQPAAPNRRPPTGGPQPAAPNRRPPTGGPQPAAPNRRPPTGGPQPAAPNQRPPTSGPQPAAPNQRRSGVIEKLEALELENPEKMEVEEPVRGGARQGRSHKCDLCSISRFRFVVGIHWSLWFPHPTPIEAQA
ncbi:myosin phosphatase Rho-interacting protein-like [Brachionichthys hirsutus]|uniref:myosin phosphatase Rho-interacting protein-like n=1 Tax=Brachionichthys hirsutus TaxID=412623 RepID=UPI003604AC80